MLCDICEIAEATVPIQLSDKDICDKCWPAYIMLCNDYDIMPSHIPKQQLYRYIKVKVRRKRGI